MTDVRQRKTHGKMMIYCSKVNAWNVSRYAIATNPNCAIARQRRIFPSTESDKCFNNLTTS